MTHFLLFSLIVLSFSYLNAQFTCPSAGLFANPDPDGCESFYSCSDGRAVLQKCPWPLVFDPTIKVCNYRNANTCKPPYGVCTGPTVVPNYADCNTFYLCDTVAHLRPCPNGLKFDPINSVCNWPWFVDCSQTLCYNNPTGAYTYFDEAPDSVTCPSLYASFSYAGDVTKKSFVYCMTNQKDSTKTTAYIVYCCGTSLFTNDSAWCDE